MRKYYFDQYHSPVPGFYIERGIINRNFSPHRHDFTEMVMILSGQGLHIIEERSYSTGRGDVFVLTGDTVHRFEDTVNLEICNIMFDPVLPHRQYPGLASLSGYQALFSVEPRRHLDGMIEHRTSLDGKQAICLEELTGLLIDEYGKTCREEGDPALILSLFGSMCFYLSRLAEERMKEGGSTNTLYASVASAHIHSHYGDELSLEDIAGITNVSARHLRRIFSEIYGMSPGCYLKNVRLQEACRLLEFTSRHITEIAFSCGFGDSNYFSRLFRSVYNCSPREYRLSHRGSSSPPGVPSG